MKILKFYADWCQPCKTQDKIMQGMDYIPIDIESEEGARIAQQEGVRGLPTIIVFDDQQNEVRRFTGVTPREKLEAALE